MANIFGGQEKLGTFNEGIIFQGTNPLNEYSNNIKNYAKKYAQKEIASFLRCPIIMEDNKFKKVKKFSENVGLTRNELVEPLVSVCRNLYSALTCDWWSDFESLIKNKTVYKQADGIRNFFELDKAEELKKGLLEDYNYALSNPKPGEHLSHELLAEHIAKYGLRNPKLIAQAAKSRVLKKIILTYNHGHSWDDGFTYPEKGKVSRLEEMLQFETEYSGALTEKQIRKMVQNFEKIFKIHY